MLFNGALTISDVSITNDEGNGGAGIQNEGKVNIKGTAKFESLRAESGGAIFNALGAQFFFRDKATALFIDCSAADFIAGALFNNGYFEFSGPALFVNTDAPSIYVSSTGETVLSENSMFWEIEDTTNPAVLVSSGGVLDIPDSVTFIDDVDSDCTTVY